MKKSSLLMMYEFYVLLCLQILVVEEINTVVGHSVGDLKLPTTRDSHVRQIRCHVAEDTSARNKQK